MDDPKPAPAGTGASDPLRLAAEGPAALRLVAAVAERYLAALDDAHEPARRPGADAAAARFGGPLPEEGDAALDALNTRLGEAVLADGRIYAGSTTYAGRVALRPAIVNWRTTEREVDLLVDVVRELGTTLMKRTR